MEKKESKKEPRFLKTSLIGFLAIIGTVLLSLFSIGFFYLSRFCSGSETGKVDLIRQIYAGYKNPYQEKYLNILLLGLDKRPDDNSLLTDTIMVISFNQDSGDYLMFSIPRDLWLEDMQTKINALYYYGQKQNPDDGTSMVESVVEDILDTEINYTLVLEMEDIKNLVDILGGIEVEVERSFTDNLYPLDDGSHQVTTVSFSQGIHNFDGEQALQFMRSRKSADEIEGTDQARQARQRKVISAIKDKLTVSKDLIKNPKKLGEIYKFFKDEIKTVPELSLTDLVSFWKLGLKLAQADSFQTEIPWKNDDEDRILTSEFINYNGDYLWVLKVKNSNQQLISDFFYEQRP